LERVFESAVATEERTYEKHTIHSLKLCAEVQVASTVQVRIYSADAHVQIRWRLQCRCVYTVHTQCRWAHTSQNECTQVRSTESTLRTEHTNSCIGTSPTNEHTHRLAKVTITQRMKTCMPHVTARDCTCVQALAQSRTFSTGTCSIRDVPSI
jgi:hypothetical protein